MSHSKERSEKICLNCGEILQNRFCPVCGQENIEPRETVWGLVSHFAYDITHFDGKFFSTVKYLLTKPGFLSLEHMKGRRARYLHPIRLYVFTSAFFFIIFFSLFNAEKMMQSDEDPQVTELKEKKEAVLSLQEQKPEEKDSVVLGAIDRTLAEFEKKIVVLQAQLQKKRVEDSVRLIKSILEDSIMIANNFKQIDSTNLNLNVVNKVSKTIIDSVAKARRREERRNTGKNSFYVDEDEPKKKTFFSLGNTTVKYLSWEAYKAVQNELPENKRDNWLERGLANKAIELNKKVNKDEKGTWALLIDRFLHTFPQVMFISLPIFALLLRLLYIRHKKLYYVDHALFSIHLYCASYIIILLLFALGRLKDLPYMGWLGILEFITYLSIFFYLYKSMRRFYGQRRFKTILKFLALNFFSFIMLAFISVVFFALSVWRFK